jgi:hypothetical protein
MGVDADEARASAGFGVATFGTLWGATEKLATIVDSIEFCTACHAEGGSSFVAPAIAVR